MESMDIPCVWLRKMSSSYPAMYILPLLTREKEKLSSWTLKNLQFDMCICISVKYNSTICKILDMCTLPFLTSLSSPITKTWQDSYFTSSLHISQSIFFFTFLNSVLANNFQNKAHFSCFLPFPTSLPILSLFPLAEILVFVTNLWP